MAIADEPPATLSTPGVIRDGFDDELDTLVVKSRSAKDWIANLQATERERLDIKSLKVGYNKVFGYYIEVTRTHSDKVPEEYIRKQTLTNAERYITPDLKEYESLVLNADERRLDIEQRLFREVCLAGGGAHAVTCSSWPPGWPRWMSIRRWPRSRSCAAMCGRRWTKARPSRSWPGAIRWSS